MVHSGPGQATRRKTPKLVAVAIDFTQCLATQNDAPGGLLEFRPTTLWQCQADTAAVGSYVCDVRFEGLSP